MNEESIHAVEVKPRRSAWLPVIGAGLLLTGGATVYQSTQTEDLRRQFEASQRDNAALRSKLTDTGSQMQSELNALRDELMQARETTSADVANARSVAARHAEVVANRIAKLQQQQNQQFTDELGKVKETAAEASTKIEGISTDVGSVRTEVASARTDIQDTRTELQRARGDMGVMSGLIATNSKEVRQLRDMGDRNIYEFAISKRNTMQRVGDIQLSLKKVDAKRNRYTVAVMADDKLVEKKDKNLNEPVQFYTSRARQPYELVVNQVDKDRVVGYLATPKITLSRQ
jgi:predicted  nucleic acid-binding Zn-ribbon protein